MEKKKSKTSEDETELEALVYKIQNNIVMEMKTRTEQRIGLIDGRG